MTTEHITKFKQELTGNKASHNERFATIVITDGSPILYLADERQEVRLQGWAPIKTLNGFLSEVIEKGVTL